MGGRVAASSQRPTKTGEHPTCLLDLDGKRFVVFVCQVPDIARQKQVVLDLSCRTAGVLDVIRECGLGAPATPLHKICSNGSRRAPELRDQPKTLTLRGGCA
jgi:hypothetical protein